MYKVVFSCRSAFSCYIGCLIISIVGQNIPAVHAEVTLAGGEKAPGVKKIYGGVFVGGAGAEEDTFWEITKAYDTRLLGLTNSGWNPQMMVGLGRSAATKNAVKAAIDRFKPGGATPLQPGDEFQFYFVGHARIGQDPLGKTRYEFGLADGVVTMDRMPYDPPEVPSLGEWLSGFPPSVTISVILVTCHSKTGAEILRANVQNSEGNPLDSNHLCIGYCCDWTGSVLWPWGDPKRSDFTEELIKGIENAVQSSGKAITKDVIRNSVAPALKEKNTGDNDGDTKIDEDSAVPGGTPGEDAMCYDDDGDGSIDEDPAPQEAGCVEGSTVGDIPTVSGWGLIIMAGLLLAAGAVVIWRRFKAVPA